jgi:putative PIN family toxin of toxin-antitoxin system
MLRAVIDTPVIVAGFIGPEVSPAAELLEAHRAGAFERVSSPRLFLELEGVLRRRTFERQHDAGLTQDFLTHLAEATLFIRDPYDLPRVTANRHHDLLVAVARAGGAKFIVTSDNDLLRSFVRDLTIVTPDHFVAALERLHLAVI